MCVLLLFCPAIFILLSGQFIDSNGFEKCGCKFFEFITFIACLGSAIVDTVSYCKFDWYYYDSNLVATFNQAVSQTYGCGGSGFAAAAELLRKPIIYEKPS